jgi:methyl-accepting chemotaxis protein
VNHDTLLTIFVALTAVAIIIQMIILFALYKAVQKSSARMESIAGRLEEKATPILQTAHSILDDAQPKISEITSNLAETTATIRAHASHVADTTGEILNRARMQAVRLDEMISSTANKVEETTDFIQSSVVTPVRRVHAVVQALSAGLGFLRRTHAEKKAHGKGHGDEEMFI